MSSDWHWTRENTISVIVVLGVIAVGYAIGEVAQGPQSFAVASVALALAFIVGAFAWAFIRARSADQVDVALDEGGIRIRRFAACEYVPFAKIEKAHARTSFGRTMLHLDGRVFALVHGHPVEIAAWITERQKAAPAGSVAAGSAASLARGGRPLDVWLERVREGEGYRGTIIARDELLRVALDRNGDVEARAAAVHKVLTSQDEEAKAQVRATIAKSMPPLVLVAASFALRQGEYVPGLDDAMDYLSPEDRLVAARLAEARTRVRIEEAKPMAVDATDETDAGEATEAHIDRKRA